MADEVQLVQHGAELLECKVWCNGAMLWSAGLKIEIDPKTGIVALPSQSNADGSGRNASAGVAHERAQLLKGHDGNLYVHYEVSAAGLFFLIPYAGSVNSWGQWKPSTPPALAEQKEKERRLNALKIGQPFPDFEAVDSGGQPVSAALLRGKVALVHFWSMADKPSRDGLAELVKLYGAHHAAGLELVSICVDGAGEPEKFAAFVREQGLLWPQVLDGEKSAGPLARQFALKRMPAVFLLGRDGRIVLQLSHASRLEQYVTARLARPPAQ